MWARRLRIGPRRSAPPSRERNGPLGLRSCRGSGPTPAALRRELGIRDRVRSSVGTVGRLVAEKGYLEFFHAARAIRAERDDVVFLAIGPVDPDKGDALSENESERGGGACRVRRMA